MKKIYLLALLAITVPVYSYAGCSCSGGTCTPDTHNDEDINACFSDGGWVTDSVINIPAGDGSVTWNDPVIFDDGGWLKGPGEGNLEVTVDIGTGWGDNGVNIPNLTSKTIKITDLSFTDVNSSSVDGQGLIFLSSSTSCTIIFGNLTFTDTYNRAISIWGNQTYGVVYYITYNNGVGGEQFMIVKEPDSDASWGRAMGFGTGNAVYLEDSTITYSNVAGDDALDGDEGSRTVIRHCTIDGVTLGGHGYDSVPRSAIMREVYNNDFKDTHNVNPAYGVQFRGGTGYVYNNTFYYTPSSGYIPVTNYRSCTGCSDGGVGLCDDPVTKGDCDGTTTSPITDGNTTPIGSNYGWPCVDQIGRGTDQGSYPLYEYNNETDGEVDVDVNVYEAYGGGTCYHSTHIQADRDYFNDTQMPAYTAYEYPHPLRNEGQTHSPAIGGYKFSVGGYLFNVE